MNYGRAFKVARALSGLEQRELAKLADIDPSHLSLIEQGKRNPSVSTLKKLAHGLKMPQHVLDLLAAEPEDLKKASSAEVQVLGELIARTLVAHGESHKADGPRAKRRTKA